ncbi:hypothetical protein FRB90_011450 [Tulasnella sp. 427]|nr:hypothetical protein FRB90_011450 [Tulasnella sp. 427]
MPSVESFNLFVEYDPDEALLRTILKRLGRVCDGRDCVMVLKITDVSVGWRIRSADPKSRSYKLQFDICEVSTRGDVIEAWLAELPNFRADSYEIHIDWLGNFLIDLLPLLEQVDHLGQILAIRARNCDTEDLYHYMTNITEFGEWGLTDVKTLVLQDCRIRPDCLVDMIQHRSSAEFPIDKVVIVNPIDQDKDDFNTLTHLLGHEGLELRFNEPDSTALSDI